MVLLASRSPTKSAGIAPPCVLFCLMATWCNAWCTARRFQSQVSKCHLCRECNGNDCLEHYAICEAQWKMATSRLQLRRGAFSFQRFLGLDPEHFDEVELQVCHVYAVKRSVDARRHMPDDGNGSSPSRILWDGHKVVATHSTAMRRRYDQIWVAG